MKRIGINITLILLLSVTIYSCRKNERDEQKDVTPAVDNATAQNVFDGVWRQIIELADSSTIVRSGLPTVAYSSLNPSIWTKTVSIDYDTGVVCNDGNMRKGKIVAIFSKKITDSLTTVTIAFDKYFHNSDSVSGNMNITNLGRKNGLYNFSIAVQNAKIYTSGGVIIWKATQTKIWNKGTDTKNDITDDEFLTTGTSSGTCLNGNVFSSTIKTSLTSTVECGYTSSGTSITYPTNYSAITLDYGTGVCDNSATATINTIETQVTLK